MVSHSQTLLSPPSRQLPKTETRQQQQQEQLPQQQPQPPSGLLLCCVCHEHNTTFRYEVVYKSPADLSTLALNQSRFLAIQQSPEQQQQQQQQQQRCQSVRITELDDEGKELETESNNNNGDSGIVVVKDSFNVVALSKTVSPVSLFSDVDQVSML